MFWGMLDELPGPKLELFASDPRDGWVALGPGWEELTAGAPGAGSRTRLTHEPLTKVEEA